MNSNSDDGLIILETAMDFETASERIEQSIEESPAELMTVFDHQENAESVDMDLMPLKVFVLGNPVIGTPLFRKYPSLGIDLPQKILLWRENGQVKVAYNDQEYLFDRHNIEDEEETKEKISGLLEQIARSAEE